MTTEHNDTTDDEPVETDGGVTNAADGADAAATEEPPARSLGELPLSRRTALKLSSAIGGTALTAGSAAATQVSSTDSGGETTLPGASVRALDFSIDSDDEVIDVIGGAGLIGVSSGDYDDGNFSGFPANSNYPAVTDGAQPYAGHPTPLTEQEAIPGNVLSEFSVDDRVFTSAYSDFTIANDNDQGDSLFQAAGFTNSPYSLPTLNNTTSFDSAFDLSSPAVTSINFGDLNADSADNISAYAAGNGTTPRTPSQGDGEFATLTSDTRFVDEFVPFGYTASKNTAAVALYDALRTILADEGVSDGSAQEYIQTDAGSEKSEAILSPADAVGGIEGGSVLFDTINRSSHPRATVPHDRDIEIPADEEFSSFEELDEDVSIEDAPTDFATDLSDVINPQLAVKVDSVGIGQDEVTIDTSGPDLTLPYTADDLDSSSDISNISSSAGTDFPSDEAVIVDETGSVPTAAQGTGYTITYENADSNGANGEVTISFQDHLTDVTLPNCGFVRSVENLRTPRDDIDEATLPAGAETTAGLKDDSTIGLQNSFDSSNPEGNFVRIDPADVGVSPDDFDFDIYTDADGNEQLLFLVAEERDDEPQANGHLGYLGGFSAFDIDGSNLVDTEIFQQASTGASANTFKIAADLGDSTSVSSTSPAANGYIQIPVAIESVTDSAPQTEFNVGAPLAVQNTGADGGRFLSKAVFDTGDSVNNQTDNEGILNESDALRELTLANSSLTLQPVINSGSGNPTAIANDSSSELEAPVQLAATAEFEAPGGGSALEQYSVNRVDVTEDDRFEFSIPEQSPEASSSVTSDGILLPDSGDTGQTVQVRVDDTITGQSATTDIDVVGSDVVEQSGTAGFGFVALHSSIDLSSNSVVDPTPVGERLRAAVTADVDTDSGGFDAHTDLTLATDVNGDPVAEFDSTGAVALADAAGATDPVGVEKRVDIEETASTGVTGDVELVVANDPLDPDTDLSGTSLPEIEEFTTRATYHVEAIADPETPDQGGSSNQSPTATLYAGGEEPQDVVQLDISDASNTAQADSAFLDSADDIADALEGAINDALARQYNDPRNDRNGRDDGYQQDDDDSDEAPSVTVEYNPDSETDLGDHSAQGYVIHSNRPVGSSFDQSIDVSSVEIARYETVLTGGDLIPASDDVTLDLDTYQRVEIDAALGFDDTDSRDALNTVNAETIDGSGPDVYHARADPLDLSSVSYRNSFTDPTVAGASNEFLGDNELTCNDLAYSTSLDLLGSETPSDPDQNPGMTPLQTDGQNVILYYDSALDYNGEYDLHDDARQFGTWGAPNAIDTDVLSGPAGTLNLPGGSNDLTVRVEEDDLPRLGGFNDGRGTSSVDRPFVEGFDIIEVKDSVTDEEALEKQDRRLQGPRGLDETDTVVQNVYGDRLEGVSFENTGDLQLWSSQVPSITTIIDIENNAPWCGRNPVEKGTASSPPWSGNTNQPNFVPFETAQLQDSLGRDVWFGTGLAGDDVGSDDDRYSETTCETRIEDAIGVAVEAEIGSQQVVAEGNTLVLGIPELQDVDSDGEFADLSNADGAQDIDQGLFVESHDDQGGIATGAGEIVVDLDSGNGSGLSPYIPEGDDNVDTSGLLDAIEDWRNDDLNTQTLLNAIESWRNR